MTIDPAILEHYPDLNQTQRAVIGHLDGPLLVIAGPGSGKTYSIVLRALNLLLLGKAESKELVLCTYAHILEQRHSRRVDRLLLYWTSEARKEDAVMVLPYDPKRVEEAGRHFDETVRRIQAGEFAVTTPPEPGICKECDLKMLCHAEGIVERAEAFA